LKIKLITGLIIVISFIIFAQIRPLTQYYHIPGTYISLAPGITEILYAIDAEDNLLAVSCCCNYPPLAAKKPRAGGLFYPSDEIILQLKPERIFALSDQRQLVANIEDLGVTTNFYKFKTLTDIYNCILDVGMITGKKKEAQNLIRQMQAKTSKYITKNPKKILMVIQVEPIISIGQESFLNDIIQHTGHQNITANIKDAYPQITLEYLIANKPDVIIVSHNSSEEYLKDFIDAKFIILSPEIDEYFTRPGPRVTQTMKLLSEL
jgi:iron complex transport system substrate-binding protein